MLRFNIHIPNQQIRLSLERRLESFVDYGALYSSALRCGLIFQELAPIINDPTNLVFASDHGFAVDLPSDDLAEQMSPHSFLSQAAHSHTLRFIDAGLRNSSEGEIDYWLHRGSRFIYRKIRRGTRNIIHEAAMTTSETHAAIGMGAAQIENAFYSGSNTVLLAGVGAGSDLGARCLLAVLRSEPLIYWVRNKDKKSLHVKNLQRAINRHPSSTDPIMNLAMYGGYEIAMLSGAILQAAQRNMLVVIDGAAAWAASEIAKKMHPECEHYIMPAQQSNDPVLKRLEMQGLVNAGFQGHPALGNILALSFIEQGCKILSR
jgi:nicotinate-nucleotide--dimethylbenzimidazole phosphoribosyltransferase